VIDASRAKAAKLPTSKAHFFAAVPIFAPQRAQVCSHGWSAAEPVESGGCGVAAPAGAKVLTQ